NVGNIINNSIREGVDLGFRFGGDEFLILVNQAEERITLGIAGRIREKFLELNYKHLDLSMGIEYYKNGCSIKDLIVGVDKKVYRAKKSKKKIIK
ncbi:unnamed protein product, partial [marine sediment metagenome]